MSKDFPSSVAALAEYLLAKSSQDPQLTELLRQFAQSYLTATGEPASAPAEVVETAPFQESAPLAVPAPPVEKPLPTMVARPSERLREPPPPPPAAPDEPLPELTLGRLLTPRHEESLVGARFPGYADASDLAIFEKRCRLKAEGCRWAARRRRLLSEHADFDVEIEPVDRELVARAKVLPDCFLWMNNRETDPSPPDPRLYDVAAGCFENVAEAARITDAALQDLSRFQAEFEQALDLFAEAQSTLRTAVSQMEGPEDSDQFAVHKWLKAAANEHQVFIRRYMRATDAGDPARREELAGRLEALDAALRSKLDVDRQQRKLLGKIRHKLTLIAEGNGENGSDLDAWERVLATIDELVEGGVPPSNRELRDLLLPHIDRLPDELELSRHMQLVLREIDRFQASEPAPRRAAAEAAVIPEVEEAARLLAGRTVVLIGGVRSPHSEDALRRAFALDELIWLETREHQGISGFEHTISRPDVALVILAIRWISHSHGDDVKVFCERHGKPLVRLTRGYNPNQVAIAVLEQVSGKL